MGKRAVLLSTVIVTLAGLFVAPVGVAGADGFVSKVVYNYCKGADPHFKVKNVAQGYTNANKLTNETWVEERPGGRNQTWKKVYTWDLATYKFEVNGDKHWLTSWRTWNGNRTHWYRIGFRVRAWHNKTLLSSEILHSVKC
jgi:hypothetical protein